MKRFARISILLLVIVFLASTLPAAAIQAASTPITFTGDELLGRPTADSVTASVIPDSTILLHYQYGTSSGNYTGTTANETATGGQPKVSVISGLTANTKYYYRAQYSTDSGSSWISRDERTFYTQRSTGSTFTFDITSDSHINIMLGNTSNWNSTLNKIGADAPDFLIDLGDTVAMDNGTSSVALGDTAAAEQKYKDARAYLDNIGGSIPLYMVAGNHEQQEAWHLQGTLANSLPVMGKNAEKKFFVNPVPNSFYSGDTSTNADLSGDHLKQDYYAWTWGDALFVVINPYWYTTTKPYTTTVGGGETDATGSGDRWDWTLGQEQFNWLKTTLQNSSAKYKFVFSHQIVGGNAWNSPNQVNYGHGGVDSASYVEWGGNNTNGSTWAWDSERPGWGSQPIRQMMETNDVTAFFHGHDHQYAYEEYNDMVYQSVPSASFSGSFGMYTTGGNSGNTIWADSNQGAGYLRVTVAPSQTTVDFIRYNGTTPAYTYTMDPSSTANQAPVVSDIPNQSVTKGNSFATVALDNYVADPDNADNQIAWSYSGNSQLAVSITNRIAAVSVPNANWTGSETITFKATDPGALFDEDVVTFTVTPGASAVIRDLPATVTKGQTFPVAITFSAPGNDLNAFGVNDLVPDGWTIAVDKTACTPDADQSHATADNRAQYIWEGPYASGTAFTAVYQVTVPAEAAAGSYNFSGTMTYYLAGTGPFTIDITGDASLNVVEGATIQGSTYSVLGTTLSDVTLTLTKDSTTLQVTSGADGSYQILANATGTWTLTASKTGYRNESLTVEVTSLTGSYTVDFKGDTSLVPNAVSFDDALACINKWKFPPADGTGLGFDKILAVINAWKYPVN